MEFIFFSIPVGLEHKGPRLAQLAFAGHPSRYTTPWTHDTHVQMPVCLTAQITVQCVCVCVCVWPYVLMSWNTYDSDGIVSVLGVGPHLHIVGGRVSYCLSLCIPGELAN